jgi:hypothetical protein
MPNQCSSDVDSYLQLVIFIFPSLTSSKLQCNRLDVIIKLIKAEGGHFENFL